MYHNPLRASIPSPPLADPTRQVPEDVHGRVPIDASVRDADALLQARETVLRNLLVPGAEVRFDHDADYALLAGAELVDYVVGDQWLVVVVLA